MYRIAFIISLVIISAYPALGLSGLGTEAEPWRIQSLADFDEFSADANYWAGFTRLETDVNLAGLIYITAIIAPDVNNSNTWFDGTAFSGVFDGNDYNIINLTIDDGGVRADYLGLFGFIAEGGEVRNLGLVSGSIRGAGSLIGGLVGYNQNGLISHCYSTSDVDGLENVGGLVGENWDGIISHCYSTGSIAGTEETVGGLVGRNSSDNVSNCYSKSDVSGGGAVGGLMGFNGGSISKCYSTGDVNGVGGVGGLIGDNKGSVSHCFSTGTVGGTGDYDHVGGLVGFHDGILSNCYSTGDVSGDDYVGGLVGQAFCGDMLKCYSTGSVSGDKYVGGIVGWNRRSVSNCYSNASVSGNERVGGLVGQNGSINPVISDPGNIYNSYSTGRVQGDSLFGGLVGYHEWGDIDGSFWDIDTSEQLESDGGTGKTTVDMKKESTFTSAGWDFVDVWDLACEGMNYPRFIWQIPPADFLCPHGEDFRDYSFFAGYWGSTNCADANDCDGADLDFSDKVDAADLKIFCDYWLNGAGS